MKKMVGFGDYLLRLNPEGYLRFIQADHFQINYTGAEANVCVSLAMMGMDTEFVTRLPDNDIAACGVAERRKFNVGTSHIAYGGERMGVFYAEKGASQRPSKIVYDRKYTSIATCAYEDFDWEDIFAGATHFHMTGITPALSKTIPSVCIKACRKAKEMGLTVSCDLNYRKNLWKYGKMASEVMPELVAGCDVILGNEEDAEKVFGIKPEGFDVTATNGEVNAAEFESVCTQLMAKFPRAKKVIITLRGAINANHNTWGGVLYAKGKLYQSRRYDITHIVDRVGGGDSFMGGLIYGLLTYTTDDQKALDFAVAASCLKHTIYGDFNQVTVEEVEKLMSGDASGRVSR